MIVNVHVDRHSPGRQHFHVRDRAFQLLYTPTFFELQAVKFVVNQRGKEDVLRTGETNTHAYARGTLIQHDLTTVPSTDHLVEIQYDPFSKQASFTRTDTGEPVSYTDRLVGFKGKVYADKESLI